jgi:hypothetical protein
MQMPLPVTSLEFVAQGDEVCAAHPLPKPQRVRHPKRKFKRQVNNEANYRSGIISPDDRQAHHGLVA